MVGCSLQILCFIPIRIVIDAIIGNYRGQIKQALLAEGISPNANFDNMLLRCVGYNDGLVVYKKTCGSCIDSGKDRSDQCR